MSETALMSLSKIRIRHMVEEGVKGARLVEKLTEDPNRLLGAILIGNNVVNIGASALATTIATNVFGSAGVGIATGVMTILVLIFGEITPKSIAKQKSEKVALRVSKAINMIVKILRPFIGIFTAISSIFIIVLGGDPKASEPFITEEELRTMVGVSEEEGVLEDVEKEMIFTEFNDKKGEIVSGLIQKADGKIVVMDLGKLEGVMPLKEQVPTETYRVNDKIRGYVLEVEKGLKGTPQVIVSRSHPDFVRKLFEFEIPEIYEGLIEIKSVSRDPGSRSKVAVYSKDENIDPVGSCVGQKGVRIQNIINELNGEKIDVIEWNADPAIYIAAALLPAQVMAVDVKEEEKFAQVIVPDDQLSLAIGKSGQNARLAARLTNWKIDIKSESQIREILLAQMAEEENEVEADVESEEVANEEE